MNNNFSVVIICKNEKGNIERVLQSLAGIAGDIVVYDSGSTDGTLETLQTYPVRVVQGPWMGFGKTKRHAVSLAQNDWVLCLDADEALDSELQQSLKSLPLPNNNVVYRIAFKNLLGDKHLRWGEWGGDQHIRLFNRTVVNWDEAIIHERLIIPPAVTVQQVKGNVLHRTMKDTVEYSHKMVQYALLNAEKYFRQGKKATWIKRWLAPQFAFAKHYIFQLGFLDGWEGLLSARMTAFYTFLKYARLQELEKHKT
ncbi:MAG TPA: glycosyltransferase family 2 protein [Flavisolibacter sp.]|jgi:glycosyltransferase involved in cell wall biosynthesis|nr:glycosyltransferase family 2 protein [Flavisolibacter sp.]